MAETQKEKSKLAFFINDPEKELEDYLIEVIRFITALGGCISLLPEAGLAKYGATLGGVIEVCAQSIKEILEKNYSGIQKIKDET
ncbi:MAG: hypothetical protein V1872_15045 [bacterium]